MHGDGGNLERALPLVGEARAVSQVELSGKALLLSVNGVYHEHSCIFDDHRSLYNAEVIFGQRHVSGVRISTVNFFKTYLILHCDVFCWRRLQIKNGHSYGGDNRPKSLSNVFAESVSF